MKLHILRHAKTEVRSTSGKDKDRKLHEKGHQQCVLLRKHFSEIQTIDAIWCSDAIRTRETLERIGQNHFPEPKFLSEMYLASRESLLNLIWSQDGDMELLLIGHNFGISELASYFSDEHIELRTGEYVCIEFEASKWKESSRGLGTIVDRYRPKVSS